MKPGTAIVIDNWAGHHADATWIFDTHAQGGAVFFPTYTPTFNPIETGFFHMKRWMQAHSAGDYSTDDAFIRDALWSVGPEHAKMAFHSCTFLKVGKCTSMNEPLRISHVSRARIGSTPI